MLENDDGESVLDYGINEAEVNQAIATELIKELDLSKLPIEVDVKNIDNVSPEDFALSRRKGFGGSDSSIILGVNPFKTLYELIEQKASPELSEEEKAVGKLAAVRKGNDLEPLIMQKASQILNVTIFKPPHMYKFSTFPYLKMNFDGVAEVTKAIIYPNLKVSKYVPVEIKVATVKGERHYNPYKALYSELEYDVDENTGEVKYKLRELPPNYAEYSDLTIAAKADAYGIPVYYYTQVQQEMMALNANYGFLAVLFESTWEVHIFFIHRDPTVQNQLILEGNAAWKRVIERVDEKAHLLGAFQIKK